MKDIDDAIEAHEHDDNYANSNFDEDDSLNYDELCDHSSSDDSFIDDNRSASSVLIEDAVELLVH